MRGLSSTALGALAAVSALFSTPAAAQPERRQVAVTVEGLFGEGTIVQDAYVPILVTLENRAGRDLRGEIELRVEGYDDLVGRHLASVDLPSGARRQVVTTVFTDGRASGLNARYLVEGALLGDATVGYAYNAGGRIVVVLGDPPRLRGALLDLDVTEQTSGGGERQVRTAVGVVRMDPASADPMLPTEAAGWSSVRVLAASAPTLARASEAQRAALADWVRAGGRLLVSPRTFHDFSDPWLRDLAGAVELAPASDALPPLVPARAERFGLACGEGQRIESFGCSAAVGFGRVYLASYDAASAAAIESGVSRELVRSVYGATEPADPALELGRHRDALGMDRYGYETGPGFGALRAALDPNESFRPALVLVALALLLYVILVGPLNFRWVQRRNQPALALVTTPVAAIGCMVVLLVVGYLGKGVSMRYRRFELVEAIEGERRAPARRYTGLYVTRPGSFDLPGTAPGEVAHRVEGGSARGPVHRHEGDRVRLTDFRAGLWETVFVREDRIVELSGAVRFERDGRRLAVVVNESSEPLRHAFVMDGAGAVYRVGDVPAGGRATIPRTVSTSLSYYYDRASVTRQLGDVIGVPADQRPYLNGIVRTFGLRSPAAPTAAPLLYAQLPVRSTTLGERFAPEVDHRWVRIAPRLRGTSVAPAPPPVDPNAYPPEPPSDDEPPEPEEDDVAIPAEVTL